ncbi:MAG TPA: hypothetical protein EYQ60_13830 [Myxococcales bacterium]|nr:hypothetical protein [Myxococcales bacterium]HIK85305.1 hypothetical protein [Myxococcales bacterium]
MHPSLTMVTSLHESITPMTAMVLLPNLGAEEGDDWKPFRSQARVRMAARLWCLLFGAKSKFEFPRTTPEQAPDCGNCESLWPAALGPVPENAVFDWLEANSGPTAWLNTKSLEREIGASSGESLSGPSTASVASMHDKAFAVETARRLDLFPRELDACIRIIDPDSFGSPGRLIESLDATLKQWPKWTRGEFTLKPRIGGSGRGRVSGRRTLDQAQIRGAFPRLAKRGGAILEPWLERRTDLSVSLVIPPPQSPDRATTILGSLEMLVTAGGVYRGHCGEVDSRGRIFSGHPKDETLRADAAAVANHAREAGFFGPCGIDAFTYTFADALADTLVDPTTHATGRSKATPFPARERLRSLVEFNARMTMGGVAIGLVRRALPKIRAALDLHPGGLRGFILTFLDPKLGDERDERLDVLIRSGEPDAFSIDLAATREDDQPRPVLIVSRDRESLRRAHRDVFGI